MSNAKRGRAEAARQAKAALAARERRRRAVLAGAVAVAVLIVAGLVGWGLWAGRDDDTGGANPPTATADGYGFARGDGPAKVEIYADFLCPNCKQFQADLGPTIEQLVAAKKITVEYRPIAILDQASQGTRYSTRAAAASAAASDGGRFHEFVKALYAAQPDENTPGLDQARLIAIGRSVGLGDDFVQKVEDRTYEGWVTRATDAASERGVTGTPTAYIAGQQFKGRTAADFTAAVDAAAP